MKKLFFLIVSAILFLLILPTVSRASSWPSEKVNGQNNPVVFDAVNYKSSSSYNIQINYGDSGYAYPVASEGKIFYVVTRNSTDTTLVAADIKNGETIWSKDFNRQILNLIYDNGRIYFGATFIYCLDADNGNIFWLQDKDVEGRTIATSKVYAVDDIFIYAESTPVGMGGKKALLINKDGQSVSNLNNFSTDKVQEVLFDDKNIYFVHSGTYSAQSAIYAFDKQTNNSIWQTNCKDGNGAILDKEKERIYMTENSYTCAISTISGQKLFDNQTFTYDGFAKYGDRIYASGYRSTASFPSNYLSGQFNFSEEIFGINERISTAPIIINDTIYYGSSLGRIFGKNLETNESNIWSTSESGGYIKYLAYASGKMIIVNRLGQFDTELIVKDINDLSLKPNDYTVTLDSPYNISGHQALLGQLHAHYISDYDLSIVYKRWDRIPHDVANRYLNAGYNFVAITEHDSITQALNIPNILDIQYAEEDTDAPSKHHILAIGTTSEIDENDFDQNRINQINSQNGLAFLSHPNAYVYSENLEELFNLNGYAGLEIYNSGVNKWTLIAGEPYALDKWDELLTSGKYEWAVAGDDYTPWDGGFDGGAVVVFSETNSQSDILQNLKNGNFYALQGSQAPRIGIATAENSITVNSDRQSTIKFIGKGGKTLQKFEDINFASYVASGDEIYVRAEIEANGKTSWTQPIKVNKTKIAQTISSGEHYTNLGQAGLVSNTTDSVNSSILSNSEYPNNTPPFGYLSPIYSFNTSGQVLDGTQLSISYANKNIFTSPSNLSIYSYNETNSVWDKIQSFVDTASQTVTAYLPHFSLYTLSADQPEDTENPSVSLTSPSDFNNLSGNVVFSANASDNNAVTSVRYMIDDKEVYKDTDKDDNGWSMDVNTNDYSNGNHKLKIEAEDFSGNLGTFETNFSITSSSFVAPSIAVTAPEENQYLNNPFTVTGAYSSQNDVGSISAYLDDIYITDADFASGIFQKEIDFGQFKEGQHQLKVVLRDKKDNIAEVAEIINVGEELKVTIISPQEKTYMHSGTIKFQYQTTPSDTAGIISKLDGKEITNNSIVNAFDLALGKHKFTVEKNGKIYAEKNFEISTNLLDQIVLINKLYKLGHIKNTGITTSIQVHLLTAEIFELLHMTKLRNQFIQKAIDFINQQNKQKKPLVDSYARELLIKDLYYLIAK